jgi:hypothetical protein
MTWSKTTADKKVLLMQEYSSNTDRRCNTSRTSSIQRPTFSPLMRDCFVEIWFSSLEMIADRLDYLVEIFGRSGF